MGEPTYPIAPAGIFPTLQGEGALLGLPMVFVRLAGCSVGCPECDTDYRVAERLPLSALLDRVHRITWGAVEWAWVTGGEPTDHDLGPLFLGLRGLGLRVALATAGTRPVSCGLVAGGPDFLSVSPHDASKWVQRRGDQLNLVPGLNGLSLRDPAVLDALQSCERVFSHRYVTPACGDAKSLEECQWWVRCRRGWKLGVQAHKGWGVP